ncbi:MULTISPECIES: BrnT family toxin [Devosia]|uniref:BrnT family toxin n=1 Tax=Devosia TaxID=46913 RepID=UPI0010C0B560|nr:MULTISPECIES: BrnT family toxin [unclassified Devosia]
MQSYIQIIDAAGFDWDDGNSLKCQKHGMSQSDIEQVFADIIHVAMDEAHSMTEPRQLAIGRTAAGRPAFVVFTLRVVEGQTMIRPVSARYMHDKELKRYDR